MFGFATTASVLTFVIILLLFLRYVAFFKLNPILKTALLVFFVLAGFVPFFAGYQFEEYLGNFYSPYRYTLYFIFILGVILFSLTLLRDVVWTILHFISNKFQPLSSPNLLKVNLITLAVIFAISCVALYEGGKVPNLKYIEVSSDKVTSDKILVLLPDLHIHRSLPITKLQKIVERANAQNPDTILLVGDMIDDEVKHIAQHLDILRGLKAKSGVYFVAGNHEMYHDYDQSIKSLEALGFVFLENSGMSLDKDFYIGGIPDIHSSRASGKRYDLSKTFANAETKQFKLLMSHTPANFRDKPFDLEVSGHTHGGQIFPFVVFIYAHAPYVAGMYELGDDAQIYVSRGAGQWGPQMRFLAPAEISVLTVKSMKPNKSSAYEQAIKMVKENTASCLVLKNNEIIATGNGRGVAPLLNLYDNQPQTIKNGALVDKVIGRAAAFIAIKAGVKTVYGEVMSEDAYELLSSHQMPATYGTLIPRILNRNKDGLCPLEQSVVGIDDEDKALEAIRNKIKELMKR